MRIDLDWLLEVLTIPHPIYNMMAGNINISKFCATVSHVISDSSKCDTYTLTSLLERGEHLDLMFSQWFNSLPNNRLPRKAQSPTGESIILYPDSTSAGVWNYYRGTRIILQRVILQIHRSLEILVLGNAFTSGTFLPRNPEEIIVEMIGEICESIPFSLRRLRHLRPTYPRFKLWQGGHQSGPRICPHVATFQRPPEWLCDARAGVASARGSASDCDDPWYSNGNRYES